MGKLCYQSTLIAEVITVQPIVLDDRREVVDVRDVVDTRWVHSVVQEREAIILVALPISLYSRALRDGLLAHFFGGLLKTWNQFGTRDIAQRGSPT